MGKHMFVDRSQFIVGIIVGSLMIVGGLIMICSSGSMDGNEIEELMGSIYTAEGIIVSVMGVILICFFDGKLSEIEAQRMIYAQNSEILATLKEINDNLKNGNTNNSTTKENVAFKDDKAELPYL